MSCSTWFDIATIGTGYVIDSGVKLRSLIGRSIGLEYKIRDVICKLASGQPIEEDADVENGIYYVPSDYIDAFLHTMISETTYSSKESEESKTPSVDNGVAKIVRIYYDEPINPIDLFNAEMNNLIFGELFEEVKIRGFDPSNHTMNVTVDMGQHASGLCLVLNVNCSWK